jgi:hypothetical protein
MNKSSRILILAVAVLFLSGCDYKIVKTGEVNIDRSSLVNNDQTVGNTNQPQINSAQITADDISLYLTGVVEVLCKRKDSRGINQVHDTGSGSLWSFPDGTYGVLTNEHVISGNDLCAIWIPNSDGTKKGLYYLDLINVKTWNKISDEAVIPIKPFSATNGAYPKGVGVDDVPLDQLNYGVSTLRDCPSSLPQGSPVTVVGYPAFSSIADTGNLAGAFKNQITTNGVISGNYLLPKNSSLPYNNFYISATIDSGNSGGVAFSKDENGLCLLGIPTWITSTGNYSNEGIVQNINKVICTKN